MWLVCLLGAVLHGSGLCRRRWTVSTSKPRGWSCRARLCKSWHGPTRPLARPPPTTKPTLPPLRVLLADVYLRPPSGRGWSRAADDVRATTTKEPMRTYRFTNVPIRTYRFTKVPIRTYRFPTVPLRSYRFPNVTIMTYRSPNLPFLIMLNCF